MQPVLCLCGYTFIIFPIYYNASLSKTKRKYKTKIVEYQFPYHSLSEISTYRNIYEFIIISCPYYFFSSSHMCEQRYMSIAKLLNVSVKRSAA